MATPSQSGRVVRTAQQEAYATTGGPGKYWHDKSNAGFSGTPLWRLQAEREAKLKSDGWEAAVKIPDGFKKRDGEWYFSEKKQVFWNVADQSFYVVDQTTGKRHKVHDATTEDGHVAAGFICHERAAQVKHVIVRDLLKAAQAMRMSLEHLDRPCALYALYEGHRGSLPSGNVCTDFCAKTFHGKLLPKLAAFRGRWEDDRLESALRESFEDLDKAFLEKNPGVNDGCSAAVALVTGRRVVVASLGDIPTLVCMRSDETNLLLRAHAVPDPDAEDDSEDDDGPGAVPPGECVRTRALGNQDRKVEGSGSRMTATPDVRTLNLTKDHRGFAFICRELYTCIGGRAAVSTVFRRSAGRPRMASGALVDAAVQWLGQVNKDCSLASIVAFFDRLVDHDDEQQAKRRRIAELTQVRLRHILIKHKECRGTIDKVRNKQVKRTRAEAERLLRCVLEECEGDPQHKLFTQRCRERSECESCLKAGELVGDFGWVKRGQCKFGEAVEAAGFALEVNQMSDLIDSTAGIHVLLRSA